MTTARRVSVRARASASIAPGSGFAGEAGNRVCRRHPIDADQSPGVVRPDLGRVGRRLLHVEWKCQVHRSGPPRGHLAKGAAHHGRQPGGILERGVPLGQRTKKCLLVKLGQRVPAGRALRNVCRHREYWDRAFVRLHHARQDIRRAPARWSLTDARLSGQPGIGIRHIGRVPFVTGQDVIDRSAVTRHGVIERQGRIPTQAEDMLDVVCLQHCNEGIGAGWSIDGVIHAGHIAVYSNE